MNKENIVNRAKEINTYEISILPYEDCCSFFVPPHPETKAKIEQIDRLDSKLDLTAMEKWTGWHASMMMAHIMAGKVKKGAVSVENAMTGQDFYNYALSRGYKIKISEI